MTDVFVSAVSVLAPGIEEASTSHASISQSDMTGETTSTRVGVVDFRFTRPRYPADDPHAPSAKDAKIIRRDVALALIGVGRLMKARRLSPDATREACLFLATGLSQDVQFEDTVTEMCQSYMAGGGNRSEAERNAKFYRALPPLMALAGLSNSSASFIAKNYGILGRNSVFGVTSHAGHCAVREGAQQIASGDSPLALVGGANATGTLSALTLSVFGSGRGNVREAEAAAFVILESEASLATSGKEPLCRVSAVETLPGVPTLRHVNGAVFTSGAVRSNWLDYDRVLFGGSVFTADHAAAAACLSARGVVATSLFEIIGCAGAASVPLDLGTAARLVAGGEAERVLCLNRDVYGRESLVEVESVAV